MATYKYQGELDDGTPFEIELDQALPEGDAGKQVLEQLVEEQMEEQFKRDNFPAYKYGQQIKGGVYDALEGLVNLPMNILNVALEFVNPQAPSPQRQPPPYQVPTLDPLPDVPPGETMLEHGVRLGTSLLTDAALGLPFLKRGPGVERVKIPHAQSHAPKNVRFYPKMYEPPPGSPQVGDLPKPRYRVYPEVRAVDDAGRSPIVEGARRTGKSGSEVVERRHTPELREAGSRGARGPAVGGGKVEHQLRAPSELRSPVSGETPTVPTKATTVGGVLDQPLSEAAARVAKSFDVPSVSAGYRNMTLREAYEAKTRILHRIAGDLEVAESLPVRELLERIEMVILSHR